MKEKLRVLVRSLAQRHYSVDTIQKAILLPTQVDDTEETLEKLIELVNQTKSEQELLKEMHKLID